MGDLSLFGDAVIHDFQVEVLFAEDLGIGVCGGNSAGDVVVDQMPGDFAFEAGRQADQPFAVFGQDFLVDAWFIVEAFHEPG